MQGPAVHNADIARVFGEIADLLEIQQANPFRIRAYRNAARIVEGLQLDLAARLAAGGDLPKLPGIGADLATKIREIAASGSCALFEKLKRQLPSGITDLLHVSGLGPKRVQRLYQELDVRTPEQLLRAARDGRLRALSGFGEKTELNLLQAVQAHLKRPGRHKLAIAAQYAYAYADYLRQGAGVERVALAGSFRRMRETVGDLDLLVTAAAPAQVMQRVSAYPEVRQVLSRGETRASVVLHAGIQVDVRVVAEECYGAALHYFTGSKAHNIAVRKLAQARGLKINEYGVFRSAKRIAGETEESVYAAVGLPYIPPELREDRGEIQAARAGELPRLIELGDLRGDLHVHTRASDGHASIRDMALAAGARGLAYLAITEHSRRLRLAHGLDPRRLELQIDEIDRLNAELAGVTVLKGIEVDILADGTLDLPDSVLSRLDVLVCISSDAHSAADFEHLRYGIGQARRGWLEKADVANTRPLAQLQRLLRRAPMTAPA